jgi:hypothetical protein
MLLANDANARDTGCFRLLESLVRLGTTLRPLLELNENVQSVNVQGWNVQYLASLHLRWLAIKHVGRLERRDQSSGVSESEEIKIP